MINQVINGFSAQVCLTVDPVGPQIHPMVVSPTLECVIGTNILGSWQNPHIDFLTYGMRNIMVEKAKRKPGVLPLPRKIVNKKQYCIPGGIA